jgi:hypothetical protein
VNFVLGFLPGGIGAPTQKIFQFIAGLATIVLFFDMLATAVGMSDDRCDSHGYYSFWPPWWPQSYMRDRATGATWPAKN